MCTVSNIFHVIKIILAKKYFVEKFKYNGDALYLLSNIGSFIIGVPFILKKYSNVDVTSGFYLVLSSLGYYYNSIVAFDLITKISPVTFSMLNIYKRLFITCIDYIIFMKIPTFFSLIGILITNTALYFYIM